MLGKVIRVPIAVLAAFGAAMIVTNTSALAYATGSVGYDIGYLQCGGFSSAALRGTATIPSGSQSARVLAARPATATIQNSARSPWWTQPRNTTPPSSSFRVWSARFTWGIVGIDSGYPFMSAAHPGNPCLSSEYRNTSRPGLYVNTGYDPSYTDANHTTASCSTQSVTLTGLTPAQEAAWAVGCSEAQGDYSYANSKGITGAEGWWLDVETANSWCGQSATNCTDLSLNQYTIQGIIDTFNHIGAVPVGIYSNHSQWTAIVGSGQVTGAAMDWYASGQKTAQQAATYCSSTSSFSGAPVTIVQFVPNPSTDRDYAC